MIDQGLLFTYYVFAFLFSSDGISGSSKRGTFQRSFSSCLQKQLYSREYETRG